MWKLKSHCLRCSTAAPNGLSRQVQGFPWPLIQARHCGWIEWISPARACSMEGLQDASAERCSDRRRRWNQHAATGSLIIVIVPGRGDQQEQAHCDCADDHAGDHPDGQAVVKEEVQWVCSKFAHCNELFSFCVVFSMWQDCSPQHPSGNNGVTACAGSCDRQPSRSQQDHARSGRLPTPVLPMGILPAGAWHPAIHGRIATAAAQPSRQAAWPPSG